MHVTSRNKTYFMISPLFLKESFKLLFALSFFFFSSILDYPKRFFFLIFNTNEGQRKCVIITIIKFSPVTKRIWPKIEVLFFTSIQAATKRIAKSIFEPRNAPAGAGQNGFTNNARNRFLT